MSLNNSTSVTIWVPNTAPFVGYKKPGEVRLFDGDLTYVELREGTFSRQESYEDFGGAYHRIQRKNMLRIKHLWVDGNDLIIVLANLRIPSVWCPWNNLLGPCYGIAVVKDLFKDGVESVKDAFGIGYLDQKSANVMFIPTPQSFDRLFIMDDVFIVSTKRHINVYDRKTGQEVTPEEVVCKQRKHQEVSVVLDKPIVTRKSCYIGRKYMKHTLVDLSWHNRWKKEEQEFKWTLDKFEAQPGSLSLTENLLTFSSKNWSNRVTRRLVITWTDGSLVYPILQVSHIDIVDYRDVLKQVLKPRILAQFKLEKSMPKPIAIDSLRATKTAVGFKLEHEKEGKSLIVFDRLASDHKILSNINLSESFDGYHKFRLTKQSLIIATRTDLKENLTECGFYNIFRVKLGCDGMAELLYKGEGVDFSSLYDNDNIIVVQKNFDDVSVIF